MLNILDFNGTDPRIAILIPRSSFKREGIVKYYVEPLEKNNISREEIIAFPLLKPPKGRVLMSMMKPCLEDIEKAVKFKQIQHIICCDGDYFKALTKVRKVSAAYGYIHDTIWDNVTATLVPNYTSLFYDHNNQAKIDLGIQATVNLFTNKKGIFHEERLVNVVYPVQIADIKKQLEQLHKYPTLSCDIESYSLKVNKAGIATIGFGINENTAVAFSVENDTAIRSELKKFFLTYKGKLIFHKCTFDTKVIIWELFMEHPRDYAGMLQGLHTLFAPGKIHDTLILAYLSLNATTKASLSLKDLAFTYMGDYAEENIKDIRKIPRPKLLEYNARDAIATCHLFCKYGPQVAEEQMDVYTGLFMPAQKVCTQMELCGMPMDKDRIDSAKVDITAIQQTHFKAIMSDPIIADFTLYLRKKWATEANKKLKKLRKTHEDFKHKVFNPNSDQQLQLLLYTFLDLPVLGRTKSDAPSVDQKTLKKLIERVSNGKKFNKATVPLIKHFMELRDASKMLTTFLPAFENFTIEKDGWEYLHGCFNMGGTLSGRQSSSDPNLTNLPSGGTQYAAPVKECFKPPPGWLMLGADFAALEDMISALQTKDPNKLKIYTDGFDGHCLRAYNYFPEQMPDIDPNSVTSINSIATKYPHLRKLSKSPTYLLTYMGTASGLQKNFGFTKKMAKQLETSFHEMYAVSRAWVKKRVEEAAEKGYAELAFGLRLRTPILSKVIMTDEKMPFAAHKAIKTVGNALGQSYGLLNTRAGIEFMDRVWKSPYRHTILPICQIHDALYFMVQDDISTVHWVNENLIDCMRWNQLPELQHPTVKLNASLEIFHPTWNTPLAVPNDCTKKELRELFV
jgi:DNA polymerase-1